MSAFTKTPHVKCVSSGTPHVNVGYTASVIESPSHRPAIACELQHRQTWQALLIKCSHCYTCMRNIKKIICVILTSSDTSTGNLERHHFLSSRHHNDSYEFLVEVSTQSVLNYNSTSFSRGDPRPQLNKIIKRWFRQGSCQNERRA